MTDQPSSPPAVREQTIREVQPGIVGAIVELGRSLVMALPPSFIMLCLLNVGFLWLVMNFLTTQMEMRHQMVARLLDSCIEQRVAQPRPPAP